MARRSSAQGTSSVASSGPVEARQAWREEYRGGSPEAERALFDQLGKRIMPVQLKNQKKARHPASRAPSTPRPCSASRTPACGPRRIPADLASASSSRGPNTRPPSGSRTPAARPRPTTPATCAAWRCGSASRPDEQHDLLATNFPVSHARDAKQFVAFAEAMAAARPRRARDREAAFEVGLARCSGWCTTSARPPAARSEPGARDLLEPGCDPVGLRRAGALPAAPRRRTPRRPRSPCRPTPSTSGTSCSAALAQGDVVFDLLVQRFVDEQRTPIEDGAVEWTEAVSPPIAVAQLVIPKQDVGDGRSRRDEAKCRPARLQPLAHHRGVPPARQPQPRPQGGLRRRFGAPARLPLRRGGTLAQPGARRRSTSALPPSLNRYRDWYRLPLFFQLLSCQPTATYCGART